MTASRSIVVAGAGIGGLTAALALAGRGFHVVVLEKAERLEEAGAGLQLSPNASRILIELGLREQLSARASAPQAVTIVSRQQELARLPLGQAAARAAAPYWVIHRADLQAALLAAVQDHPAIELRLGCQFEDVTVSDAGVSVGQRSGSARQREPALALIGADGLWSAVRAQLFPEVKPRFSGLIAWRGTIEAAQLPREFSARGVQLFLGSNAHLVAYPISNGRQINIVAIVAGDWNRPGWSEPGESSDIQGQFAAQRWSGPARMMVGAVGQWRRWALFTLRDGGVWSSGPTALLGDAAHAMLPFAAQGAGMAIEDAAVLAQCLGDVTQASEMAPALQRYTGLRQRRVAKVQRAARQSGRIYHLAGPMALARDLVMRRLGGERLLRRNDWIYDWTL